MSAELVENPPESDQIELLLRIQGVGPGQPRRIVVSYAYLLSNQGIDADELAGLAFEADVEQVEPNRWEVTQLSFAGRVLRPKE